MGNVKLNSVSGTNAGDIQIELASPCNDDIGEDDTETHYRRMWKNMAPICNTPPIIRGLIPSLIYVAM
jgi:hypothetical protein